MHFKIFKTCVYNFNVSIPVKKKKLKLKQIKQIGLIINYFLNHISGIS